MKVQSSPLRPLSPSNEVHSVAAIPTEIPTAATSSEQASLADITYINSDGGITTYHRFKPNDRVWAIIDNQAQQLTVVKVTATHRSLISTDCHLQSRITYLLSNSRERLDNEVFATLDDLIQSIYHTAKDE